MGCSSSSPKRPPPPPPVALPLREEVLPPLMLAPVFASPLASSQPSPNDGAALGNGRTLLFMRESSSNGQGRLMHEDDLMKKFKAHKAVFAKGFGADVTISQEKIPKTAQELEVIMRALQSCYLFAAASDEQREELAAYMHREECKEGETVVLQGEPGDKFYVIQSGVFEFFVDRILVTRRSPKFAEAYFGELALLYNSPRQATAVCASLEEGTKKAVLWAIDRDTFRHVLARTTQQSREEKRAAVQAIPLLRDALSEEQLNRVIEAVQLFHFSAGQRIVRKGDKGDVCFFIRHGTVECSKIGEAGLGKIELGPGTYFGERALVRDEPRAADVVAISDVVAMALDRKSFNELLGPLRAVMDDNMKERVVEALPILRELSAEARERVVSEFRVETFNQSDVIVKQGDVADKFFVIRQGKVRVVDDCECEIAVLKESEWFGEMGLLNNAPRNATCIAATPSVECFVLQRSLFTAHVANSQVLRLTADARAARNAQLKEVSTKHLARSIELHQLERLRILGKGTFGTVYLVQAKLGEERSLWALKMMNKYCIVRGGQRQNVCNEKALLSECAHPFVLALIKTFQDRDSLFMLLEFVQGGELFSIMQRKFRFPLYPTFFYAACLVDVFEHLHGRHIVYRDLKPENVLIDKRGYLKLADFGFAKRIMDKSFTLCGTPEYLAPEVVLGTGHNKAVDYWGLGILVYEMLVGISPFADDYENDQHVLGNNIVNCDLSYDAFNKAIVETESKPDIFWTAAPPTSALSMRDVTRRLANAGQLPVENLVRHLLTKNPIQRLGNLRDGVRDIKRHIFFSAEIDDWDNLRRGLVTPPYVPKLMSDTDTSSFDAFEPDTSWPEYKDSQDWCREF